MRQWPSSVGVNSQGWTPPSIDVVAKLLGLPVTSGVFLSYLSICLIPLVWIGPVFTPGFPSCHSMPRWSFDFSVITVRCRRWCAVERWLKFIEMLCVEKAKTKHWASQLFWWAGKHWGCEVECFNQLSFFVRIDASALASVHFFGWFLLQKHTS